VVPPVTPLALFPLFYGLFLPIGRKVTEKENMESYYSIKQIITIKTSLSIIFATENLDVGDSIGMFIMHVLY
jgi:hypothetical protein